MYRQPFLIAALFCVTVLHTLATLSRSDSAYLLAVIRVIVFGAFIFEGRSSHPSLSAAQQEVLRNIPLDIRTVISSLDLEPEYLLYACCPRCFARYAPNPQSPKDPYPHCCTYRPTPEGPACGETLVECSANGESWTPIRPFPFQSLLSWIAQLCARPGLEEHLCIRENILS